MWHDGAVMNAEPFHRGLRFRHNHGAECAASECSLMCKDLSYNGYTKKVIDPQVRCPVAWLGVPPICRVKPPSNPNRSEFRLVRNVRAEREELSAPFRDNRPMAL